MAAAILNTAQNKVSKVILVWPNYCSRTRVLLDVAVIILLLVLKEFKCTIFSHYFFFFSLSSQLYPLILPFFSTSPS